MPGIFRSASKKSELYTSMSLLDLSDFLTSLLMGSFEGGVLPPPPVLELEPGDEKSKWAGLGVIVVSRKLAVVNLPVGLIFVTESFPPLCPKAPSAVDRGLVANSDPDTWNLQNRSR